MKIRFDPVYTKEDIERMNVQRTVVADHISVFLEVDKEEAPFIADTIAKRHHFTLQYYATGNYFYLKDMK